MRISKMMNILEPSCSRQSASKRKNLRNPKIYQVADKHQISHIALTELLLANNTNEKLSVNILKRGQHSYQVKKDYKEFLRLSILY